MQNMSRCKSSVSQLSNPHIIKFARFLRCRPNTDSRHESGFLVDLDRVRYSAVLLHCRLSLFQGLNDMIVETPGSTVAEKLQYVKSAYMNRVGFYLSATTTWRGRPFKVQLSHPSVPWCSVWIELCLQYAWFSTNVLEY